MGFRENLKDELTYQDITVKELSDRTGISKHTIDHYLTKNGSQPQAELAVKIAQALNVSVESLVLGKDFETPKKKRNIQELNKKLESLSDRDYDFVNRIVSKLN
ncbi:MAG: helix-turn-helix transcriptional regulator [Spirochaetaceae bacterium]|nr:helix-turn-helix transcriptional regulator [Spirochaetaceae bacterium]